MGSGNRHPIPTDRVPAVAMIGWHVARLLVCRRDKQNGVDVQEISNLAIGFLFLELEA